MIYFIKQPSIYIGPCIFGTGIFAKCDVTPGQILGYLTGQLVSFDQAVKLEVEGANCVQVAPRLYVNPGQPFRNTNHSCNPNAGILRDVALVALRPIPAHEQVCFDYSTTMLERYFTLDCQCGEPQCRGLITDFDLLPRKIQGRYLDQGVVQSFIVNYLEKSQQRHLKDDSTKWKAMNRMAPLDAQRLIDPQWLQDAQANKKALAVNRAPRAKVRSINRLASISAG